MSKNSARDDLNQDVAWLKTETRSVKSKLESVEEALKLLIDRVDKVLNNQDFIFKFIKDSEEERTILASGHKKTLEMSDRVEKLEKIHSSGQHSTA